MLKQEIRNASVQQRYDAVKQEKNRIRGMKPDDDEDRRSYPP